MNRSEVKVGLNHAILFFVEDRVGVWCRRLSSESGENLETTVQGLIDGGLAVLNQADGVHSLRLPNPPVSASEDGGQPFLPGLKPIGVLIPNDLQNRLEKTAKSFGLDSQKTEDIKAVAAYLIKAAYFKAHPQEPVTPPSLPPPTTIFRQIPQSEQDDTYASVRGLHQKTPFGRNFGSDRSPELTAAIQRVRQNRTPSETQEASLVVGVDGPLYTGGQLKILREELGLSQAKLAQLLGVSRPLITEAEAGRRSGEKTRKRLSDGLRGVYEQEGKPIPVFEVDQAE